MKELEIKILDFVCADWKDKEVKTKMKELEMLVKEFIEVKNKHNWSGKRRNKMGISKERAEQLRNKLLVRIKTDLDDVLSRIIDEAAKDPLKFLFSYVEDLKSINTSKINDIYLSRMINSQIEYIENLMKEEGRIWAYL